MFFSKMTVILLFSVISSSWLYATELYFGWDKFMANGYSLYVYESAGAGKDNKSMVTCSKKAREAPT